MTQGPVLVDLQGTQSLGHRGRGISRYATELALALERIAPERVHGYVLNPDLAPPGGVEPLVASGKLVFADEAPCAGAALLHLTSPFELSVPIDRLLPRAARAGPRIVATLFDLIPEVFAELYLADPGLRRRYRARTELVRQADRVVAISRHSAGDGARLLGIPPHRLAAVPLAPGPAFVPAADRAAAADLAAARVPGLRPPFVLYTGGSDGRKNVERLVEAWGRLATRVHGRYQLVIACDVDPLARNHYEVRAAEQGVGDDLLVTGWLPDDVLVTLTQSAALAVWPSLYEGFGLPVAEALACATPVIASATSAHPELLPAEALFDPGDAGAIAAAVDAALAEGPRREALARLARDSPRRTWDDVARDTLAEYEAALAEPPRRRGGSGLAGARATSPGQRRHSAAATAATGDRSAGSRLAVVTPLPPQPTGVADYSARLVPALAEASGAAVDVYVDGPPHARDAVEEGVRAGLPGATTRHLAALGRVEALLGPYDGVVYCLGNSEYHTGALAALLARPGVVLAHDVRLATLYRFAPWQHPAGAPGGFAAALHAMYPGALPAGLGQPGGLDAAEAERWGVLMVRDAIAASTRFLTTSAFAARLARLDARPADRAKIQAVPFALGTVATADDASSRRDDGRTVTTFGVVSAAKQTEVLLDAFAAVHRARPGARLVFAGRAGPAEASAVRAAAARLGIGPAVEVTGGLGADAYRQRLRTTSVAVQLRELSNGEWSAALGDCMVAGVPTVATGAGSAREIPSGAVRAVPAGAGATEVAAAVLALLGDEHERRRMGAAAVAFAAERTFAACAAAFYGALGLPVSG